MANSIGPNLPGASIWGPHPKSKANQRTAQDDADQSTKNAQDQIARNQQSIQDAQQEANANLQHIRESYDEASTAESTNQEDALAKQRLKGYEELRDLKRQQEAEVNRVRREGERNLQKTQEYYRDTLSQNTQKGEQDLKHLQANQNHEMQYVASTGQSDLTLQKGEQTRKIEDLKKTHDEQFTALSKASESEYERMQKNTELATEQQSEKFQGHYKAAYDESQRSLDNLNENANEQIREIRQDTAQKLAAYRSRQSDPFYKMVDMNAELRDEGDKYVLTANIPSHEQQHVSIALKGNILVLSGNRRNEEKLDLAPGKFKGTSSYQSFQESFPLSLPVDRNGLTKEFRGDQVIITIPKSTTPAHEGYEAKLARPERVRAERPHFPGNLPGISEDQRGAEAEPSHKDKTGRTLT